MQKTALIHLGIILISIVIFILMYVIVGIYTTKLKHRLEDLESIEERSILEKKGLKKLKFAYVLVAMLCILFGAGVAIFGVTGLDKFLYTIKDEGMYGKLVYGGIFLTIIIVVFICTVILYSISKRSIMYDDEGKVIVANKEIEENEDSNNLIDEESGYLDIGKYEEPSREESSYIELDESEPVEETYTETGFFDDTADIEEGIYEDSEKYDEYEEDSSSYDDEYFDESSDIEDTDEVDLEDDTADNLLEEENSVEEDTQKQDLERELEAMRKEREELEKMKKELEMSRPKKDVKRVAKKKIIKKKVTSDKIVHPTVPPTPVVPNREQQKLSPNKSGNGLSTPKKSVGVRKKETVSRVAKPVINKKDLGTSKKSLTEVKNRNTVGKERKGSQVSLKVKEREVEETKSKKPNIVKPKINLKK